MGIPASRLVSVAPQVIAAGGTGVTLTGLFLTNSQELGYTTQAISFASATAVANFFGASSNEAVLAGVYFAGFDGSNIKPSSILFAYYSATAGSGTLLSGQQPYALNASGILAVSGTISLTVAGSAKTTATISLASATSYSNVASIVTAAFSTAGIAASLVYDSNKGIFYIQATAPGTIINAASSPTGNVLAALGLDPVVNSATIYAPTPAMTPTTCMQGIYSGSGGTPGVVNWASFSTVFEPVTSDCLLFAQWSAQQGDRFCYIPIDTDPTPTNANDTTSLGYNLKQAQIDATAGPIWSTSALEAAKKAAFVMGAAASIDFTQINGRITFDFKSGGGLLADVTSDTVSQNLLASGYNFYATYSAPALNQTFFTPGSMPGQFTWLDSYYNQIWLNSTFQANLLVLLRNRKSIPYNASGYAMIPNANQGTVNQAVAFGAIRQNVSLSASQVAALNADAGFAIDGTVSSQGYAWVVQDPGPTARVARTSPVCMFFYTDGGSIQRINMSSYEVQ